VREVDLTAISSSADPLRATLASATHSSVCTMHAGTSDPSLRIELLFKSSIEEAEASDAAYDELLLKLK
jgi:hypothetical protein